MFFSSGEEKGLIVKDPYYWTDEAKNKHHMDFTRVFYVQGVKDRDNFRKFSGFFFGVGMTV